MSKKLLSSTGKFFSSTLIRRQAMMAENFTLFAIEDEIPAQVPKNIARRANYNSTNDNCYLKNIW